MKFLRYILVLAALTAWADEPVLFIPLERSAPLANLVALAKRPEEANARAGYDEVRCEALRLLSLQPKGAPDREKAIKDALLMALSAKQPQVRNAGAAALAKRGYRSEIGGLFSRLEADPEALVYFYRALESPQREPPVALLRAGLQSSSAAARAAVAEVVGLCRVKALAGVLERFIDSDTDPAVRDQAAIALSLLGARDSRGALLRLRAGGYQSLSLARALIELGGDEEVQGLLPLLWDGDPEMRNLVAEGLAKMPLHDRETATQVLLIKLRDSSPKVRIASAQALARFRELRAIPILRETLPEARDFSVEERSALVQAVAAFDDGSWISLLNEMLNWRFREECGLEAALAKIGHPSSGAAAWNAYVDDLKKWKLRRYLVDQYTAALPVISACADAALLTSIRDPAEQETDVRVKGRLDRVADTVAKRLAQGTVDHRPLPSAPVALALPDTDDDGVPDVRDKYPKDERRVEDISIREIKFAEKRFAMIPLRTFAQGAREPQFLTIDDDGRVGYVAEEANNEATAFRVVSTDGFSKPREWMLPNPGTLAGIEQLVPADMNARGTVIGTATWKTDKLADGNTRDEHRLAPGSGFVFKAGKLTLSSAPPHSAATLRSTFKMINQRGQIFGHREERITNVTGAHIRIVAFFGEQVFRDVPPFEVTTITETGCLLCYREATDGRETFIWDGSRFISLAESNGIRVPVRAVGMNAKLQVIGGFESANRGGAGPGFLWEKGKMRPLAALIPDDQRIWLQSIEPRMIGDSGCITLTAELPAAGGVKSSNRQHFELTVREKGEKLLERLRFD